MTDQPRLTDRAALARNRTRASDAFLHKLAVDEAQDRLAMVNRAFTNTAVVSPRPELWEQAMPEARIVTDANVLDLEPESHDLIIHAMALHWADDAVGQVIQCRRALRPDGLFLAITPGGQTLSELRAALAQAESELSGGLSPRVLPMGDIRDLGALLQRAGLALPVADSVRLTLTHRDMWHLMHDLRAWGEANALHQRLRRPSRRAVFDRAARLIAEHHGTSDGRIASTLELVTLTAWAPGPNQPKPLRPGSATSRLANALGTDEFQLPD